MLTYLTSMAVGLGEQQSFASITARYVCSSGFPRPHSLTASRPASFCREAESRGLSKMILSVSKIDDALQSQWHQEFGTAVVREFLCELLLHITRRPFRVLAFLCYL